MGIEYQVALRKTQTLHERRKGISGGSQK